MMWTVCSCGDECFSDGVDRDTFDEDRNDDDDDSDCGDVGSLLAWPSARLMHNTIVPSILPRKWTRAGATIA